ncbi:hypothetical protein FHP29_15855 [Nocardioides albidus]|uniref:Uncharacterized protein n=1 Tax=Nocardioides albidus TaxID=1517589 RepID=A0A5C4VNA3_9ACTN|nr:hypothetical protein [Nocardioides albidus]TNM37317.1 hypothetical protein FHP29_15855 [Nocardioides albidus]
MRGLLALACLALGAGVGLCAVLLHGYGWGLGLGIAATAATLVALPGGWRTRLAFALGWTALLGVASFQRPEGDYLIAGDASGYLLLATGAVVLGCGFVGLVPRRASADDEDR